MSSAKTVISIASKYPSLSKLFAKHGIEAADEIIVYKDGDKIEIVKKGAKFVFLKPVQMKKTIVKSSKGVKESTKKSVSLEEEPAEASIEAYDPKSYVLPALYATDAKGKLRIWKIWAIDDAVYKIFGEVGGIKTPSERRYKGMNEGRKNATTAEEQAMREAERDWIKQLDKGYRAKEDDEEGTALVDRILKAKQQQGNRNTNISGLIRGIDACTEEEEKPELASSFDKSKTSTKKITKAGKKITKVVTKKNTSKASAKAAKKAEKKANLCANGELEGYETPYRPMHCQVWTFEPKVYKHFDFDAGVYCQPKLDGVRILVILVKQVASASKRSEDDYAVVFISRGGNQIVHLNHLRKEVKLFLKGRESIVLDCEGYADVMYGKTSYKGKTLIYEKADTELKVVERFDVISGAVRPGRTKPHVLEEQICLHVFDIADTTLTQGERFAILDELFASPAAKKCPHIKRVETKMINDVKEIQRCTDEFLERDYEGVVLRAKDLKYEYHKKSLKMRKYKSFEDKEFAILGIECDDGVERENFTWVCQCKDEKGKMVKFYPKPIGTREQRWEWYDNVDDYIGKLLTVRYQVPCIIPRFPRGIGIRQDV